MEQQVAEVAGVQCFQPRLIERVEMLALAVGIGLLVGGIEIAGNEAAVLPFVDEAGELACGPASLVEPFGLAQLLRSEEHTSEPQSLMRTSYAVFCMNTTKSTLAPY